jgi:hypothetical protein
VHRRRDTSNRLRRLRSLSRAGGAPVFVPRAPPEPRTRSREFASAAPSTGLMPSRRRCTSASRKATPTETCAGFIEPL